MTDHGFKTFLVRYNYDGAQWGLELKARDLEDAKARLGRLSFATVDGEHVMTLSASTGPLAAIIAAFRNAVYRLFLPSESPGSL